MTYNDWKKLYNDYKFRASKEDWKIVELSAVLTTLIKKFILPLLLGLYKGVTNMRLWHIDLIPYLPRTQLLSQWRELNSIFKKQDNHILINYIYDYDKKYLLFHNSYIVNLILDLKNKSFYN